MEHGVRQGGLGDCWLLAAMAAISEWPERIKKIMNNVKEYPKDGKFELTMWLYGKPTRVTIDDNLPGKARGTKFWTKFTHPSRNGAWWATILEKAAAKYYGTYRRMRGGWMNDALDIFTGIPTG